MPQLMPLIVLSGLALASLLPATPARAQTTRTWVSGTGDDANPCSRSLPCRTFAGAITRTVVNGEINCITPGGFGPLTISKSITIDCHDVFASILNGGVNGINIRFDNFAGTDTRKTVRLRNLNVNGLTTGLIGINITGESNAENSLVFIEDCLVDGMFAGAMRGISDTRNGGGLSISNTAVRNIGGIAIAIAPAGGGAPIDATLHNVRAQHADIGLRASRPARVLINHSVLAGHTTAGIEVDDGIEVNISNSTISNNRIGIRSGGGPIRLSNNEISFNRTGIAGPTTSFGNNRLSGNMTPGTAPTAAGAISNDLGQQ